MIDAHPLERAVGVERYASSTPGTGGRLRESPGDFRVREIEDFAAEPAGESAGDYPHVVVRATLTDWDTNGFARALSNRLGISRERVNWAGTKDKNAVTTQLFTVRAIDPGDVPDIRNAEVEVVGRAGRNIQFGDLVGNEFEIVVRDPDRPENANGITDELAAFGGQSTDAVAASAETADAGRSVAAPNFFGQQRFGSYRPVTHEVGLAVVRGDWEGAVLAYVGNPSEHEPPETRAAREFVEETRDWSAAIEEFPGHLRYERTVLNRLAENGGESEADFRAALETFPSNLQRLFVHAAQSYAFNRILSERMARGLPFSEPVEGDVVCFADADAPGDLTIPDPDRLQRATSERVSVLSRHAERGRAFVTAPLVGTETDLADGEQGDIERDVLADLDIAPSDFDLPGEFHSEGTRRAILVRTDIDVARDPLTFTFALPKGSYATVVLREYLKTSPLDL
ncbi:tRNA pseudouridine(13) synthase TruD [Salarchaeum sp. JOR-1]|uniref:tRNA pseudouridine(13) synthase TruD n=1 Tax=Salarchaeum sp. JOR-1 TaxID=2599399 RepID=UPI0011989D40|nr:tRNA pseudouridine(13) synthase TruD [Salarchaeum sp. JOR-1]QDX39813.1 tRNA pseudouridine(13) synthase TruD [Salarchaeum sp. JOR-1]